MYSTSCQNFIENDPELSPAFLFFCGHPVPHMEMGQPPMNQTSLRLQLKLFLNEFLTRCRGRMRKYTISSSPLFFLFLRQLLAVLFRKKCSEMIRCRYPPKKTRKGGGSKVGGIKGYLHIRSVYHVRISWIKTQNWAREPRRTGLGGVLSPVSFGTVADDRACIEDLYGTLQEERTESQYNNTAQCSTVQYAILHVTVLVLCGIVQRRDRRIWKNCRTHCLK